VLLCAALEVGLGSVIDKFAGEGASNNIPSELTSAFEEACLGYSLGGGH